MAKRQSTITMLTPVGARVEWSEIDTDGISVDRYKSPTHIDFTSKDGEVVELLPGANPVFITTPPEKK